MTEKKVKLKEKVNCHDCKRPIEKGDLIVEYPINTSDNPSKEYVKCKECYEKDPLLRNYKTVECYSRVCGYMRPVNQWNPGKQEEFKDRKEFKIDS